MKIHNYIVTFGVCLSLGSLTVASAATDATTPPAPAGPDVSAASTDSAAPVVDASGSVQMDLIPKAVASHPIQYNLARWYAGSAIVIFEADGSPRTLKFNADERALSPYSTLLDEDATQETPLAAGVQQVVVNLNSTQTIQRIAFFSFDAAGSVDVFYSNASEAVKPGSADWKPANLHKTFSNQQSVTLDVTGMDAHYVQLAFNVTKPGGVGSLAILSNVSAIPGKAIPPKQQDSTAAPVDSDTVTAPFDYAPTVYGSHVSHVAGGPVNAAQLALDGDPTTGIPMGSETKKDTDNILLVDLGVSRDLSKLGVLFKTSGKGKFEFYLLNGIPDMTDAPADNTTGSTTPPDHGASAGTKPTAALWRGADGKLEPLLLASSTGSLADVLVMAELAALGDDQNSGVQLANLPASFFVDNKPAFTQEVTDQQARVSIDMKKASPARYVMLRWVPSTPNQPPIEVFEVNLIGIVPIATFVAASRMNANSIGGITPAGVQVTAGTPGFVPTTLSTAAASQTPTATASSSSAAAATPPTPEQNNPPPPPNSPDVVSP